ncbi:MAG: nicotinate-nucleotide adenylyltransferase [Candidatus Cohnella colombiensis]|uniref:Probable nicotinate-nucleotide adenylyltransferase n=1 Tax=Candidatus Cohnella colombiensis TaxID=3121368 RepID=A0AA95F1Q7_9BACL|nr:MAG: nicotinate-nucleotide adenylyltransferase [Cohnella sp.]
MRKIGLFGGTFDPIHLGHLLAAESARETANLEEIWFIPTAIPPHKPGPGADARARCQMIEAAIGDNEAFRLELVELEREGTSYTIDTINELQERHPHTQFYWIVGSDMVNDLPNWRKIDELVERVSFIGLERPDQPIDESELPSSIIKKLVRAQMPPLGISSTDIRHRVREGKSVRYMVPNAVLAFIRGNDIYGT